MLPGSGRRDEVGEQRKVVNLGDQRLRQCPKCGQAALVRQEGCDSCTSCDYSKCG
jgi:ribonucleoside-diphosphate reductase alpha chain